MSKRFDVLIVGGWPGGYQAALRAGPPGMNVVRVDANSILGAHAPDGACRRLSLRRRRNRCARAPRVRTVRYAGGPVGSAENDRIAVSERSRRQATRPRTRGDSCGEAFIWLRAIGTVF